MSTYCMNYIPLKPGVWAIALLQLMYGSVMVYMGEHEHLLHELYPPQAWCVGYSSIQLMYGSVRVYMGTLVEDEDRGFYFYLHLTGHCVSLAAAAILVLGLL